MVRVDGKTHQKSSAAAYKLNGGETIEWFYTKDWTTVPGAMDFMKSKASPKDVITSGASGPNHHRAMHVKVKAKRLNADGTKETRRGLRQTASISDDHQAGGGEKVRGDRAGAAQGRQQGRGQCSRRWM